jgi:hypothetical protein
VAVGWVGGVLFLRLETAPFIRVLDVFVEAGLGVLAGLAVSRVRAQAWYLGWTAVGVAVIGSFAIAQELTIFARSGPMIFIFGAWVGTTWALNNRRESSG